MCVRVQTKRNERMDKDLKYKKLKRQNQFEEAQKLEQQLEAIKAELDEESVGMEAQAKGMHAPLSSAPCALRPAPCTMPPVFFVLHPVFFRAQCFVMSQHRRCSPALLHRSVGFGVAPLFQPPVLRAATPQRPLCQ